MIFFPKKNLILTVIQNVLYLHAPSLNVPSLNDPSQNIPSLNISSLNVPSLNIQSLNVPITKHLIYSSVRMSGRVIVV